MLFHFYNGHLPITASFLITQSAISLCIKLSSIVASLQQPILFLSKGSYCREFKLYLLFLIFQRHWRLVLEYVGGTINIFSHVISYVVKLKTNIFQGFTWNFLVDGPIHPKFQGPIISRGSGGRRPPGVQGQRLGWGPGVAGLGACRNWFLSFFYLLSISLTVFL